MQSNYNQAPEATASLSLVSSVLKRVYFKMFLALMVTAATALYVTSSPALLQAIFSSRAVFFGMIIAELGVVFVLSGCINRLSNTAATLLFYLYSVLNGVVLSSILLIYTATSVAATFFITAGVFGAMTLYGLVTSRDLSRFGSIMVMALIGLIICSVVNMFMQSTRMEWIISFAGVIIFIGLTAWDTQRIRQTALYASGDSADKLATLGALSLYLDFVNMFLYLLRFFGNSRD